MGYAKNSCTLQKRGMKMKLLWLLAAVVAVVIVCYIRMFNRLRRLSVKVEESKEWKRIYDMEDPAVEKYLEEHGDSVSGNGVSGNDISGNGVADNSEG